MNAAIHDEPNSANKSKITSLPSENKNMDRINNSTIKIDTNQYPNIDKHYVMNNNGEWQCKQCNKLFKSSQFSILQAHFNNHVGIKPYRCNYCPKSFSQRYSLTIHERIHTGVKPYQCNICNKSFTQVGLLRIHKKRCVHDILFDV